MASAGSRAMRAPVMARGVTRLRQDLGHPAVDDALAVRARVGVVDREDLGSLQDRGQRSLRLHLRVRRDEIDLVPGVEALHCWTGRPVDQLLPRRWILRALQERDALR